MNDVDREATLDDKLRKRPMNTSAALTQYGQIKNDAQTAYASPHQLVLMLFDGAIEAMSITIGAIQSKDIKLRGDQSSRGISIIIGLRDALDMKSDSELSDNLYSLYGYMSQELFKAAIHNDVDTINNVQTMLIDIRKSWEKIPLNMHYIQQSN
jgi:flagellar protein FliS